jgi:hypothetical protein
LNKIPYFKKIQDKKTKEWKTVEEKGRQNEQDKTIESAAGRAIVLKPAGLDVDSPIDVLLHLHGYTSRGVDPFAGWRQSRKQTTKGGQPYHAVRDVDQDRIAQQIGAAKTTQTLGILPQGVGHSEFAGLVPRTYVDAVLKRLEEINELPAPKAGGRVINLVLSGHSGAGATIARALRAEVATAGKQAKARPVALNPVEVVLFEAINGSGEFSAVTNWIDLHLNRVLAAEPKNRSAAIAACPILRAYRSKDMYVKTYDDLNKHITEWFDNDQQGGKLDPADRSRLRQHFKVEVLEGITGQGGHEKVVGGLGKPEQGPLADALLARTDPSTSALLTGAASPPVPKAAPGTTPSEHPRSSPATTGAVKAPTPTTTPAPAAPAPAPTTTPAPRSVPTSGFIHDVNRTTWELLPKDKREHFESIEWNDLDYPKAKLRVENTLPANLDKWRSTPGYILFKTVKKKKGVEVETWFIKGSHQRDAADLFRALAKVRPGGGERRANIGETAILTQDQYVKDPDKYDKYINDQLRDPEGEKKIGKKKMLNKYAVKEFERMRDAAAKDGVVLSIGNAFRERKQAQANAAAKDNPAAVASYSAHSLGLAVDLNLRVKGLMDAKERITAMTNTVKLMGAPAYKWVFQHGADFGFYQYRPEPWHWEYNPPGFAEDFWAEARDLTPEPVKPRKSKR